MTRKERIHKFAKSLKDKHFLETERAIEDFIEDELKLRDKVYEITEHDLLMVYNLACNVERDLPATSPYYQDPKKLMAYTWTMGAMAWLRSKDMLYFIIGSNTENDKR